MLHNKKKFADCEMNCVKRLKYKQKALEQVFERLGGFPQAYPQGDYVIKNTLQIPQITASNWILSVLSDRIKI